MLKKTQKQIEEIFKKKELKNAFLQQQIKKS